MNKNISLLSMSFLVVCHMSLFSFKDSPPRSIENDETTRREQRREAAEEANTRRYVGIFGNILDMLGVDLDRPTRNVNVSPLLVDDHTHHVVGYYLEYHGGFSDPIVFMRSDVIDLLEQLNNPLGIGNHASTEEGVRRLYLMLEVGFDPGDIRIESAQWPDGRPFFSAYVAGDPFPILVLDERFVPHFSDDS